MRTPPPLDEDVVRRVLAGDVRVFRVLVERYQGAVAALVARLLPRGLDREGVCQEVFVNAYVRLSAFDPERGSFRAWLLASARNRALNERARKRPDAADLDTLVSTRPAPDVAGSDRELFEQLDHALDKLPIEQRTAFLLAEVHGLTYAETAAAEGVPIGTIRSRISRARERLQAELKGRLNIES